jgi:hypothetical protein
MSSHRKRFSMDKLVTGTENGDWEGPPGYQAGLEATSTEHRTEITKTSTERDFYSDQRF